MYYSSEKAAPWVKFLVGLGKTTGVFVVRLVPVR
jgi:hypothetical protein